MREAVVAQLRYCAELLNARCSESVRGELLTAVGSFAETAGYMADDDFAHDDARRMHRFALACTEESGDWHLHARVLCSMAFKPPGAATRTRGSSSLRPAPPRMRRGWPSTPRPAIPASLGTCCVSLGAGPVRRRDPEPAERRHRRPRRSPARTRNQIRLASLITATGEPVETAALGDQALDWEGTLRPRRAIADLRDRIGTTIAA